MDAAAILDQALAALPAPAWHAGAVTDHERFVAAAVALAAYAHPAAHELKDTRRAIVVPSDTFRDQVRAGSTAASLLLRESDARVEFVETRYFVAALARIRDFVLVGYRGTADLYDTILDLNIRKVRLPAVYPLRPRVHAGFSRAFLEGFPAVVEALERLEPFDALVGAGHSLGGAMCSLHNAMSHGYGNRRTNTLPWFVAPSDLHPMKACVTFGAPRVGNRDFAAFTEWGFHFRHPADPVPMVPLRSLAYENQPIRSAIVDAGASVADRLPRFLPLRRKRRLVDFGAHRMERYLRSCAATAGVSLP